MNINVMFLKNKNKYYLKNIYEESIINMPTVQIQITTSPQHSFNKQAHIDIENALNVNIFRFNVNMLYNIS